MVSHELHKSEALLALQGAVPTRPEPATRGVPSSAANTSTSALGSENVAMSWRSRLKVGGGRILWPVILSRTARCIFTGFATHGKVGGDRRLSCFGMT